MQQGPTQRIEGGRRTRGEHRTEQPLVSIIIVVRNGANDLPKALASVFAQYRTMYELIIVDGISTDGTLDIIERYSHDIDYWISEADNGIYDAMNKAVKLVTGKYVYFLGCDDKLAIDLNVLGSTLVDPNTIYYGNVRIPARTKPWDGPYNAWKLARRTICQQAIFYPIKVFQSECFCTDYKLAADYAFNLRCFGDKLLRFQYIPHVIADYSNTGVSALVPDVTFERDRIRLIRKHLPVHVYLLYNLKQKVKTLIWSKTLRLKVKTLMGDKNI